MAAPGRAQGSPPTLLAMGDLVLVATAERVRTVTLNRPEARNALNAALQEQAAGALTDAERDGAVDVVILTGADPAFCAGLDLRELGDSGSNLLGRADDAARSPFGALRHLTKPVIGAINGACATGGFELALACDLLVASERAKFVDTHARVGVSPGGGMSVLLPQAIGIRRAKELSFTASFLDAEEAFRIGLVNHLVAHDELLPTARGIAAEIVANDQPAVRNLKSLYDRGSELAPGDALALEQEVFRTWRVDPAEVERRRSGIVARGREQAG